MGKRIDGEELRGTLIKSSRNPGDMTLGEIVREIIMYSSVRINLTMYDGLSRGNTAPDVEVLDDYLERRMENLFGELDKREKLYGCWK